jgi:hypothetical protein
MAHLYVISAASAITSSWFTSMLIPNTTFAGYFMLRVLHTISFDYFYTLLA